MKETEPQRVICDYLAYKKHFFWRNNNTPIYDQKIGGFRKMPKYGMRGLPDIIVIKDGWFIGLEVKTKKGQLGKDQKEFRDKCKEYGVEYYVVSSIDDVQDIGL